MITAISSPANPQLRLVRSLAQAKRRRELGLFRLEGFKAVAEALEAGVTPELVLYLPGAGGERGAALVQELAGRGAKCLAVSERLLADLAATVTPQGLVAVFRQREVGLEAALAGERPLVLVVDAVQDPGNLGTLLRTAAAAGASAAVLLRGTVDVYGDKVLRASMGAVLHLPLVARVAVDELLRAARARGLALYLASSRGGRPYQQVDWRGALALAVGNEGRGLRPELEGAGGERVHIPLARLESLNVGVAAGLLLFEAARQRAEQ